MKTLINSTKKRIKRKKGKKKRYLLINVSKKVFVLVLYFVLNLYFCIVHCHNSKR